MRAMTIDMRDPMVLGIKYKNLLAQQKKKQTPNFKALILCYGWSGSHCRNQMQGFTKGNAMEVEMEMPNGSIYTFS